MWGLSQLEYNRLASEHSRANIVLWIIAGIIYNIVQHNLFSLSTLLLIIPGIFVISFASMPTFWVEIKKRKIIPETKSIIVLTLFTVWYVVDLIYPIALAIGYIKLIERFL